VVLFRRLVTVGVCAVGAWLGHRLGAATGAVLGGYVALFCGHSLGGGAWALASPFWIPRAESIRLLALGVGSTAGAAVGVWLGADGSGRALGLFLGFAAGGLLLGVPAAWLGAVSARDPVATAFATLVVGAGASIGHDVLSNVWGVVIGMVLAFVPASMLARRIAPQYVRRVELPQGNIRWLP
jgi:hypothetical protein